MPPPPDVAGMAQMALHASIGTPPDVAVQAKQAGVTPGVIQAGFKPQVPLHPVVAAYVGADLHHAQVSQDDLGALNNIAHANDSADLEADARQAMIAHHTFPESLRAMAYENLEGMGQLLGMVTSAAPAALNTLEAIPGIGKRKFLDDAYAWTDSNLNGLATEMQTLPKQVDLEYAAREAEPLAKIWSQDKGQAAVATGGVILRNLPTILTAVAGGEVATLPILAGYGGQAEVQARSEGLTPREAVANAGLKTGAMAAVGFAPFRVLESALAPLVNKLAQSIGVESAQVLVGEGLHNALRRTATGMATEALHGAAFGAANDLIDRVTNARPDLKNFGEDVFSNAAAFALLHPVNNLFHPQAPAVQESMDNQAKLTQLHEATAQSATAKRDPQAFKTFMDATQAARNEQYQAVPKDAFDQLAATAQMSPYAFASKHGALDGYLQSMREGNTAVMVPTAHVIMADDETFKGLAENSAKADGGLTPVQAREVAKTASKGEPTGWDEIKQGHWAAFARSVMGLGAPRTPVINDKTVGHLDDALRADDANTLGPKMMGHVLEGLRGEGTLDQPLRERYGVTGSGPWPQDKIEAVAMNFKRYMTDPDAPQDKNFSNLADTLEYTYRMHRLSGQETHNSVFDRLISGRMVAKAAALDMGRDAWFKKTGNEKYDDAVEQAQRSVQATIMGRELKRVDKEETAEYKGHVNAIAAQLLPSLENTRWHKARMALGEGTPTGEVEGSGKETLGVKPNLTYREFVASMTGYNNTDEMDADLKANPPAEKQARTMAKQLVDKNLTATSPDDMADHLWGVYASTPVEKVVKMSADELLRQNPKIAMKLKDDLNKRVDTRYRQGVEGLGLSPRPRADIADQISRDIGDRTLGEFKPGQYLEAQKEARREAAKAYAGKNPEDAILRKGEELYNIEAYRQALKIDSAIRKGTSILKNSKDTSNLSPRFAEQVTQVLAQFGKAKPENGKQIDKLPDFLEHGLEPGDAADMPILPSLSAKLSSGQPLNLRDLSIKEYLSLADTIRQLGKLGRSEKADFKLSVGQDFQDMVDQVKALPHDRVTLIKGGKKGSLPESAVAVATEPNEMFRALDKGNQEGPFHQMGNKFRDGLQTWQDKYHTAQKQFVDAMKDVPSKPRYELPETLKNLDSSGSITGRQFLDILGKRGDAQHWDNFCKGYDVDPQALHTWISRESTPEQWDRIANVAKTLEWVGQEHQKMLRDTMSPEMQMVKHVPFAIGDKQMPGWYWPSKVDPSALDMQNAAKAADKKFMPKIVSTGHEITRVKSMSKPLLMDIAEIPHVLNSMINDTEMRGPAKAMAKFLAQDDVKAHVTDVLGKSHLDALNSSWQQALGSPQSTHAYEKTLYSAMAVQRRNFLVARMSARLGINLLHLTSSTGAAMYETNGRLVNGMKTYTTDRTNCNNFMSQVSPEMKMRLRGVTDADSVNLMKDFELRVGDEDWKRGGNMIKSAGVWMMHLFAHTNNLIAGSTFMGEYQHNAEQGVDHQTAVNRAEEAVIRAVGPANRFDVGALFGTNNEFLKDGITYLSYFNHVANRLVATTKEATIKKAFGSQKNRLAAIAGMLAYSVMPSLVHYWFEGNSMGPESADPDSDLSKFLGWQAVDTLSHMNPVLTRMAQSGLNYQGDTIHPDAGRLFPEAGVIKPFVMSFSDVYNLASGNTDDPEKTTNKLWGDLAGGIGSLAGIPGAEQMALTAKFVDAIHNGDWDSSSASPARKAIVGLTTGHIPGADHSDTPQRITGQ